jgi:hypothetical protein
MELETLKAVRTPGATSIPSVISSADTPASPARDISIFCFR